MQSNSSSESCIKATSSRSASRVSKQRRHRGVTFSAQLVALCSHKGTNSESCSLLNEQGCKVESTAEPHCAVLYLFTQPVCSCAGISWQKYQSAEDWLCPKAKDAPH